MIPFTQLSEVWKLLHNLGRVAVGIDHHIQVSPSNFMPPANVQLSHVPTEQVGCNHIIGQTPVHAAHHVH